MQGNIQGNMHENRDRNVAYQNRTRPEILLERVTEGVLEAITQYMEVLAEAELDDANRAMLDEMFDQLVQACIDRWEESRILARMRTDIEQRIMERMIERIPRNETRQVGDGPHGRRIDVVLNEDPGGGRIDVFLNHEAENQESSGDEQERSDEEDAIHLHE